MISGDKNMVIEDCEEQVKIPIAFHLILVLAHSQRCLLLESTSSTTV